MLFALFDSDTKRFTGFIDAQESPLEPGVFLKPEYCTDIMPMNDKVGFTQLFNGKGWEYEEIALDKEVKAIMEFKLTLLSLCFEFRISYPF